MKTTQITPIKICFIIFISLFFIPQIAFAQGAGDVKSEIYSKLKCCPCKVSFEKCVCPEAKEMKVYIDALLDSGVGKDDIYYKIAKKYSLNVIIDAQVKEYVQKRLINEAGVNRPQINITPAAFDFGEVSKSNKGKIKKSFKLSNKGNAPLIVKAIKTLCPCAYVSLNNGPQFSTQGSPADWQVELKPNQTADLELMVDLLDKHANMGKLVREALVVSNDPLYPEIKVRVEADVKD